MSHAVVVEKNNKKFKAIYYLNKSNYIYNGNK